MQQTTDPTRDPADLQRARNLFRFLAEAQRLMTRRVPDVDRYDTVIWYADLPQHSAITIGSPDNPEGPLLTADRIPRSDPPKPAELAQWLATDYDDPTRRPRLRDRIVVDEEWDDDAEPYDRAPEYLELRDDAVAQGRLERWLAEWDAWAQRERVHVEARRVYADLFNAHVAAGARTDEVELVLGIACLGWSEPKLVRRHLITIPVRIDLDDSTGRLAVRVDDPTLTAELDMLDADVLRDRNALDRAKSNVAEYLGHPLDAEAIGELVRPFVNHLDPDGSYDPSMDRPERTGRLTAHFAPAIIVRKRSNQGLIKVYETIVGQLDRAGAVPRGLLPSVDPDFVPGADSDPTPGAIVDIDGESFLPMPVNERQLKIIKAVDERAQVLVQGPPGTGKTHTAAALLSHLLAQGKRVLVTAQTDRALREVSAKLPAEIQPLSVSVVGRGRGDMADLKRAVETISSRAAEHDPRQAERMIGLSLQRIDDLRRRRHEAQQEQLRSRQDETRTVEHQGYRGTPAAIARQLRRDADSCSWLLDYAQPTPDDPAPLSPDEAGEWLDLLYDDELTGDEPDPRGELPDLRQLPNPDGFARLCHELEDAEARVTRNSHLRHHAAFSAIESLPVDQRTTLTEHMRALVREAVDLEDHRSSWLAEALTDVRSGRQELWVNRCTDIATLIEQCLPLVDQLGHLSRVELVAAADRNVLRNMARGLHRHVADHGPIKTRADGSPKVGILTSRLIKESQIFFAAVRVDGLPATSAGQQEKFERWCAASDVLDALDSAWPAGVHIPAEDTLSERLHWHITELGQLRTVLGLAETLRREERSLAAAGIPHPDWNDVQAIRTYADMVELAAAEDAAATAARPLRELRRSFDTTAAADSAPTVVRALRTAAGEKDIDAYVAAYQRLTRLRELERRRTRSTELGRRLRSSTQGLVEAARDGDRSLWRRRINDFGRAWHWVATRQWAEQRQAVDMNNLQSEVIRLEEQLRQEVEKIAAIRAWTHAVAPGRLTGSARANLTQYAQLVRRLGKGTGKYSAQRRAEIRQAMDRCRPAVPVWIMPLYRLIEQLEVREDMFDVVVVDEASQASMEATFLQYLAPRIVVIGDDKQVSPSAVGVDQGQLRNLGDTYLADNTYRASWQDPKRSLFDEAVMRFGGKITLVEHRRCVPEIIGFSNRIAYEPEGIRLVPVRQYGSDRLDPVRTVRVDGGQQTAKQVNPAEVEAVVEQVLACLDDPRYDGMTFGVMCLLGSEQAKRIEAGLLDRVQPEEWAARDLRCGQPPDFQGSERNVIFLSMVAAPEPGKRMMAQTIETFTQRYNVAVSRARDQIWVFHSMALGDLGNPEDMRFQLLDYCASIADNPGADLARVRTEPASDDQCEEPFASLFEQKVFNHLLERGYRVIPDYVTMGSRLDLVVVGDRGKLAIECDGDYWDGAEEYVVDMGRQRELECCGWQICRLRQSAFISDEERELDKVWASLDELGIMPTDESTVDDEPAGERPVAAPGLVAEAGAVAGAGSAADAQAETPPDTDARLLTLHDPMPDPRGRAWMPNSSVGVSTPERGRPHPTNAASSPPVTAEEAPSAGLEPYHAFTKALRAVQDSSETEIVQCVHAIVAYEGPVLGGRIHRAYARACGHVQLGRTALSDINRAITAAVRLGVLVVDDPLHEAGTKPKTYRLPTQPAGATRELGPRRFEDIPPLEIAELLRHAAQRSGWGNQEVLFRSVLDRLGLTRMTEAIAQRLHDVLALTSNSDDEEMEEIAG